MTNEERWNAFIVEKMSYIEEDLHLDNTKGILPAQVIVRAIRCDSIRQNNFRGSKDFRNLRI